MFQGGHSPREDRAFRPEREALPVKADRERFNRLLGELGQRRLLGATPTHFKCSPVVTSCVKCTTRLTSSAREVGRTPTGGVLAKPGSSFGRGSGLGGWVKGCRWLHVMRSRRSTPGSTPRPPRRNRGRMLGRSRGSHWLVAGQHPAGDRHGQQAQGPGAGSHTQATGAHLRV